MWGLRYKGTGERHQETYIIEGYNENNKEQKRFEQLQGKLGEAQRGEYQVKLTVQKDYVITAVERTD